MFPWNFDYVRCEKSIKSLTSQILEFLDCCKLANCIREKYLFLFFFLEMKKFLLYARRSEIRGVDIDNPYFNFITAFTVPDIDDVTVIDFDASEERLYWTDIKTQTIKRAFINGTGLETVISRGKRFTH